MPVGPYIVWQQRDTGRRRFSAQLRELLEGLRRSEFRADGSIILLENFDRHKSGALLEQQPRRRFRGLRRQYEGGPDIGMAGERKLLVHGENAHLCVMRGIARRQHESRLGIIELRSNGLHLRRRKPSGVQHHRERIAAKGAIGKNVHGDIAPLHLMSPIM